MLFHHCSFTVSEHVHESWDGLCSHVRHSVVIFTRLFHWMIVNLSFLQVWPIYLFECVWISSNFIESSLVHSIPITLITMCYVYIIVYIRRRSISIRRIHQRANDRRDLSILTRVFILLALMIRSGLPQMGIGIYYHYSGFLPSWATFSVLCATIIICKISLDHHFTHKME